MEKVRTNNIIKSVFCWILLALYVAMTVIVIVLLATDKYDFQEIKNVGTSSLTGLVAALLPVFCKRVLKIEMSLWVILFVASQVILNTLGEIFDLYYRLPQWDTILHLCSGYGFTFLIFGAFYSVKVPQGKGQTFIYLSGALALSLAVGTLWELVEWGADSIFGTNMLKGIPENHLFNGGLTDEPLAGTDAEIAAFYRNPSGYLYALQDILQDLLCCVIGAVVFSIEYMVIGHRHPRHYRETFVKTQPKERLVK